MAITTRDELINAIGNDSSRIVMDKLTITGQAAGTYVSLWRATGQPGQGAIPTSNATCNNTTVGCFGFTQQTPPDTSYITYLNVSSSNPAMTIEIHDRLLSNGGMSGTITTTQNTSMNIANFLSVDNLANRIGDANYSDIQWWVEWYTATGVTSRTLTANVSFNDGTFNTLTPVTLAATRPASFMQSLNGLIQAADAGKYIRSVNSILLSGTTGTAGNFGITATRQRAVLPVPVANKAEVFDWAQLGLPEIANNACLFLMTLTTTTSSGSVRGGGKISHG